MKVLRDYARAITPDPAARWDPDGLLSSGPTAAVFRLLTSGWRLRCPRKIYTYGRIEAPVVATRPGTPRVDLDPDQVQALVRLQRARLVCWAPTHGRILAATRATDVWVASLPAIDVPDPDREVHVIVGRNPPVTYTRFWVCRRHVVAVLTRLPTSSLCRERAIINMFNSPVMRTASESSLRSFEIGPNETHVILRPDGMARTATFEAPTKLLLDDPVMYWTAAIMTRL